MIGYYITELPSIIFFYALEVNSIKGSSYISILIYLFYILKSLKIIFIIT